MDDQALNRIGDALESHGARAAFDAPDFNQAADAFVWHVDPDRLDAGSGKWQPGRA